MVLRHILHFYRTEGPKPHMQGDVGNVHSFFLDRFQKLRGEMEPCRGSCCRAFMLRVDGLVAVLVLQLMGNIGRQRHLSQLIQDLLKDSLIGKLDQAVSFLHHVDDLPFQQPAAKGNPGAHSGFLSWFYQCFPDVVFPPFQEEYLDLCLGSLLDAEQPCRDHLCIIDDQAVSGIQVIDHLFKNMVLHLSRLPVQHHQP